MAVNSKFILGPDLSNVIFCKLMFPVTFTKRLSEFFISVSRVVFSGSNKQMGGSSANCVVTMVKNRKPIWHRAMGVFPSQTMNVFKYFINACNTVSTLLFLNGSGPFPTLAKLWLMLWNRAVSIQFGPEGFWSSSFMSAHNQRLYQFQ